MLGRKAVVWRYRWQKEGDGVSVLADSDWGGSRWDRKSTSGGVVQMGGALRKDLERYSRGGGIE